MKIKNFVLVYIFNLVQCHAISIVCMLDVMFFLEVFLKMLHHHRLY